MLGRIYNPDEWHGIVAIILTFIAGVVAAIGLLIAFVFVPIGKHYDAAACHSFGDRTGREVKFVTYTYWSWDCITPSSDGKWLSTDRLWEETPGQ